MILLLSLQRLVSLFAPPWFCSQRQWQRTWNAEPPLNNEPGAERPISPAVRRSSSNRTQVSEASNLDWNLSLRDCDSPIIAPFHACSETNYSAACVCLWWRHQSKYYFTSQRHTHQVNKFEVEIRFRSEIFFAGSLNLKRVYTRAWF